MANEPQQVDLLRGDRGVIFSVTESHPESLNDRGSENTKIARIIGPIGSVVCFFDDQQFRTEQNALEVTKTVAEPIEVPIAQNFLSGEQQNGIYFGARPGYNWAFSKHVAQHSRWLDIIIMGAEAFVESLSSNSDNTDHTTTSGTLGETIDGFTMKGSGDRSDNNRVDNLSSIRFGGEPLLNTSTFVARALARF